MQQKTTKVFFKTLQQLLLFWLLSLVLHLKQNVENKEMLKNQGKAINHAICLQIAGVVVVNATYFLILRIISLVFYFLKND